MTYVWINPVAERMYETEVLDRFLNRYGYQRCYISNDWLAIVKQKYRLAVEQSAHTVVDMRCPRIRGLLDEIGITAEVTVPDIEPILIHCGRECSEREDLQDADKIITTPCQALADMGNALGIKGTWFVPWNKFVEMTGSRLRGEIPEESPIPPGFFSDLEVSSVSITGEENIRNYLKNEIPDDVQLMELLFCEEGCHNGDGISRVKRSFSFTE